MILEIGQHTLKYFFYDARAAKDIDLVMEYKDVREYSKSIHAKAIYPINNGDTIFMRSYEDVIHEASIAWEGSMAEKLLKWVEEFPESIEKMAGGDYAFATPELSLLLKHSHKYKKDSSHFLKTMRDIQYLEGRGVTIPEAWIPFLKEREKDTYNYSLPNLMQGKDSFFDSDVTGVIQVYDHDSVHEAVKIGYKPAYKHFIKGDVWCDKEMFEDCSEDIKLYAVIEEALVLAIERSQVPYPSTDAKKSFEIALMKVCTSITSGWFREYAWNNYDKVVTLYNEFGYKYMDVFRSACLNNKVLLKGETK